MLLRSLPAPHGVVLGEKKEMRKIARGISACLRAWKAWQCSRTTHLPLHCICRSFFHLIPSSLGANPFVRLVFCHTEFVSLLLLPFPPLPVHTPPPLNNLHGWCAPTALTGHRIRVSCTVLQQTFQIHGFLDFVKPQGYQFLCRSPTRVCATKKTLAPLLGRAGLIRLLLCRPQLKSHPIYF